MMHLSSGRVLSIRLEKESSKKEEVAVLFNLKSRLRCIRVY